MYKLTIELVPSTSWYNNVRSNVSKAEWDTIRKYSYHLAGNKCQICNQSGKDQGYKHDVECHEIWEYNEETKKQILVKFISLCPLCHKTKHVGLAQINGEGELVVNQLMSVNGITKREAEEYIEKSFLVWMQRSKYQWELDIEYLSEFLKKYNDLPWWEKPPH